MQIRLRENYVPGHDKTRRKAEAERHCIGCNLRRNPHIAINMNRVFVNDEIESNKLNNNVENSIGTTACQVSERLGWYPPRKRLMKKINNAYYYMSYSLKQKKNCSQRY